jgi:AraC-like DNA-binding protein
VRSWTNATAPAAAATNRGVLRPDEVAARAALRRDHPVHPDLAPYVERFWSVSWDRRGQPTYRSEVLSHPSVNVCVESGSGERHGHPLPAALVHGVVTRRFVIDLAGWGAVTGAKLRPGGFVALTGAAVPIGAVRPLGEVLPDAIGPVAAQRLVRAVLAVDGDPERTDLLQAALLPLAGASRPAPEYHELQGILVSMADDRTLVRVDDVARLAGSTPRSLQRLFARYLGVGPKWVLARYRLQDAAAAIDSGEATDLAGLAVALGWFDQAHFSRDFRALVGQTPSAYLGQARRRAALADP